MLCELRPAAYRAARDMRYMMCFPIITYPLPNRIPKNGASLSFIFLTLRFTFQRIVYRNLAIFIRCDLLHVSTFYSWHSSAPFPAARSRY